LQFTKSRFSKSRFGNYYTLFLAKKQGKIPILRMTGDKASVFIYIAAQLGIWKERSIE